MNFKLGVTFTGTHRSKVNSIVNALLDFGFSKDDIFYDEWHDVLVNGIDADIELGNIYANHCDCVVVFLAEDYNTRSWTRGVEWRYIRKIINTITGKKICLLNIDNVDINKIDGLSSFTDIAKNIETLSIKEVAEFIKKRYELITNCHEAEHKKNVKKMDDNRVTVSIAKNSDCNDNCHIYNVLFVTANEYERKAFEEKFIRHEEKYIKGKTYYLGVFARYSVAYIHVDEQGVTSPSAIPLVGQLVSELRPEAVVMVGIAFGADENKQKIGDVLVSDKILPYDSQRLLENKTEYKEDPKEVGFQLLNAFRECREWVYELPNLERSVVYIGSILTGSRLINNYRYRTQLLSDFSENKPIGGEMEAQGIYAICRLFGVAEWIIIKSICDWGYKKDNANKETDQETAARAAVDYCFHVFSRNGVFNGFLHEANNINANIKFYPSENENVIEQVQNIKNMATLRKMLRDHSNDYSEEVYIFCIEFMSERNSSELRKLCQELINADRTEEVLFNIAICTLARVNQNELYKVFETLILTDSPVFQSYFTDTNLFTNRTLKSKFIATYFDMIDKSSSLFSKCSFYCDKQYKLDKGFFATKEVEKIEQSFHNEYKIVSLSGIPGSGKNFIAKMYANTHRAEFPIIKSLKTNRTSDNQVLSDIIISALRFDESIVSKCVSCSVNEQMEIKVAAFNSILENKLIIVSGVSTYTNNDIESLVDLDANFILCTDSRILHKEVVDIPIVALTNIDAIELFKCYYTSEIDDNLLTVLLSTVGYHVGTIIFLAKLMTYHSITISDILSILNSTKINKLQIPTNAGAKMTSLTQYHYALFAFDKLNSEEDRLLLILSLLPNKSYHIDFLKNNFHNFDFNCVISLSLKGYIDYDDALAMVKCSPLIYNTYLESHYPDSNKIQSICSYINSLLNYDNCREFSEIEEKISYGITLVNKLSKAKDNINTELYVKIAQGYQLLCLFSDAQKYVDLVPKAEISKDIKVSVIRIKIDIMVFCFDYQSAINLLKSFIRDTVWEQLTDKEQGELHYKLGIAYTFIKSDMCQKCFKLSFRSFQKAGIIVGEYIALLQLIINSKGKKNVAHEMKIFATDSKKVLASEPIWSYLNYSNKDIYKAIIKNGYSALIYGTANDFINSLGHNFLKDKFDELSSRKIYKSLRNRAKSGSILEQAICQIEESGNNKDSLRKSTQGFITFFNEITKIFRTINVPLNSEISTLSHLMNFFPKELEIIDTEIINTAIIKLFTEKYNALLPTNSDKLLASSEYAQMLIAKKDFNSAIKLLVQQINILSQYLPPNNRYPLVILFETLARCYNSLKGANSYSKADRISFQQKERECWLNAGKIIIMLPNAFQKQAEILFHLDYYDAAIKILEEHKCNNCTLCNCYFNKALKNKDELEEMKINIRLMKHVQKSVVFCSPSSYAEKLYKIGDIFMCQKKPNIKYNLLAFIADKKNKKTISSTASLNSKILSDYFYKNGKFHIANYFLKHSAIFALNKWNTTDLMEMYTTYFIRSNIEKEADLYKHELVKQYASWVEEHFANTARYYYGKEDVSRFEVAKLLFDEVDDRVHRMIDQRRAGLSELLLVSFAKRLNTHNMWFIQPKWNNIKRALRFEFFFDLIFNFRWKELLTTDNNRLFLLVYNLSRQIDALLDEHKICEAENLLYKIVEENSSYNLLHFCKYFYFKLGQYSDSELIEANFSRKEVYDGLAITEQGFV